MRAGRTLAAIITVSTCIGSTCAPAAPAVATAFDSSHSLLSKDLKRYVHNGRVNYTLWSGKQEQLTRYLQALADLSPEQYKALSLEEKKALWVNAYNAMTIKIVLDHYPIKGSNNHYPPDSLRQIENVWESATYPVAGRKVNLYQIEHDILRRELSDARLHFVVVCAALGCPLLRNTAYTGGTIEKDLENAEKRYLADTNNVEIDFTRKSLKVSTLFKWFPLDFAALAGLRHISFPPPRDDEIVSRYILSRLPDDARKRNNVDISQPYSVFYRPFDWALNDAR